jgi:hypothetical protein
LAKGLFATSASSQAFESGHGNCGKESHDPNDGKKFDEGERRRRGAREEGAKGGKGKGRGELMSQWTGSIERVIFLERNFGWARGRKETHKEN